MLSRDNIILFPSMQSYFKRRFSRVQRGDWGGLVTPSMRWLHYSYTKPTNEKGEASASHINSSKLRQSLRHFALNPPFIIKNFGDFSSFHPSRRRAPLLGVIKKGSALIPKYPKYIKDCTKEEWWKWNNVTGGIYLKSSFASLECQTFHCP